MRGGFCICFPSKACWKVYVVVVILAAHLEGYPIFDKYDFAEVFSGVARCARLGRLVSWRTVAVDVAYTESMDINGNGGFVLH